MARIAVNGLGRIGRNVFAFAFRRRVGRVLRALLVLLVLRENSGGCEQRKGGQPGR